MNIPYSPFILSGSQIESLLQVTAENFIRDVNTQLPTWPDSKEKAVIISLRYNNLSERRTPAMNAALTGGDRAEVWYQIRYESNGDGQHSNRRYLEAHYFGLYDPGAVDRGGALNVYQMVSKGQNRLRSMIGYEAANYSKLGGYLGANDPHVDTLQEALAPASSFLTNRYAAGIQVGWKNIYVSASSNAAAITRAAPLDTGAVLTVAAGLAGETVNAVAGRTNVMASTHDNVTFNAGAGETVMIIDSAGAGTFNTANGDAVIIGGSGADHINVRDAQGKVIVVYGQGGADEIRFQGDASKLKLVHADALNVDPASLRNAIGRFRQDGMTVVVEVNSTRLQYANYVNGTQLLDASVALVGERMGTRISVSGNPVDEFRRQTGWEKNYSYKTSSGVTYAGGSSPQSQITAGDFYAWLPSGERVVLANYVPGAFGITLFGNGPSSKSHVENFFWSGHGEIESRDTEGLQLATEDAFSRPAPLISGGLGGPVASLGLAMITETDDGLFGDSQPDVLDPGGDHSYVDGGGGGDTIVFNKGYGYVRLKEIDSGATPSNTLAFGAGIAAADLEVTVSGDADIMLRLGDDTIVLEDALLSGGATAYGVQHITFADGAAWTYSDLLAKVGAPSLDSDTIYGDRGGNILNASPGVRQIVGGGGGDTINFHVGDGALWISETDNAVNPANVLAFGAGISEADVSVAADDDGNLILHVGTGDDFVVLRSALDGHPGAIKGVQAVQFAGGASWSYADLLSKVATPAAGALGIFGDSTANSLDTLGVVDHVSGGGGGDTIVFAPGYGVLTVNEADHAFGAENILAFQSGVSPADVSIGANDAGDIILTVGSAGDQVILQGALNSTDGEKRGVQRITFAGGQAWTYADLIAAVSATPSGGELQGDTGANTLDTHSGAGRIIGRGGGDTIVFNVGYGAVTIDETEVGTSTNSLAFGAGIAPQDVVVSANDDGDLILTIGSGADKIVLSGGLTTAGGVRNGVDAVTFAGGASWSRADLVAKAGAAIAGKTVIYGGEGADVLDASALVHLAVGGGGGDTFIYKSGYGVLTIRDADGGVQGLNTLAFGPGITVGDVAVSTVGGDVVLQLSPSDKVILEGAADAAIGVQKVTFSDGTAWSASELAAFVHGAFEYRQGEGERLVNLAVAPGTGFPAIHLGPGLVASDLQVSVGGAGNRDLVVSFGLHDRIVFKDALALGPTGPQLTFASGTSLNYGDLLSRLSSGDAGDVAVVGTSGADVLDTRGQASFAIGQGGGDTFIYNRGYGAVSIDEVETGTALNSLSFGAGVTSSDVAVVFDGNENGDLVLKLSGGDEITLSAGMFSTPGAARGVQRVSFADGSSWTRTELLARATTGSEGTRELFGSSGAEIFDPNGFAQTVRGGGGGDTIIYKSGYGDVTIDERDPGAGPANVLAFGAGISSTSIEVDASEVDIYLFTNDGAVITLAGALGDTHAGVQSITFADGVSWSRADLLAKLADPTGKWSIYGDAGANRLDTEGEAHVVVGNGGGDTIIYGAGYGVLDINERDTATSPANVLKFEDNTAPSDILVTADGDALVLNLNSGPRIRLTDALRSKPGEVFGVQSVQFSNGATWTYADLLTAVGTASAAKWGVYGDRSANVLDVNGLTDFASGGGGGDTFVYKVGYGGVTVSEIDEGSSPLNTLQFGVGIDPADILVEGGDGGDLLLRTGAAGDVVTILGGLFSTEPGAHGVQRIAFANGVTWSAQQLFAEAAAPLASKDAIYGTAGADILDGQGVTHRAVGGGGGDTFVYKAGYGALELVEQEGGAKATNVLAFGAGILPGDVAVTVSGDDLILSVGNGNDQVTIRNALASSPWAPPQGIQKVTFANGVQWTRADLINATLVGSPTNTRLRGDENANIFDPNGFANLVQGGGGGDTILYKTGYGAVAITEAEPSGATNRLVFGAGIAASDVGVKATEEGDIVLSLGGGDEATLVGALTLPGVELGVQQVMFADGAAWSREHLKDLALTGSASNTVLYGWYGQDVLNPNGFAHEIHGRGGGDLIRYEAGFGDLLIEEKDFFSDPTNVLQMGVGFSKSNVSVSHAGGDVILNLAGGAHITLQGQLFSNDDLSYGVQKVQFSDGSSWSNSDLADLVGSSASLMKSAAQISHTLAQNDLTPDAGLVSTSQPDRVRDFSSEAPLLASR